MLTGASGAIVVRNYGPNLDQLRETAQEVADVMAGVDGVTNLKIEPQVLIPQIVVKPKTSALAQFGLSPGDVRSATTTLVRGTQVGEVFEDERIFRVVVWGTKSVRRDVDALRELMIDTPAGGQVPLKPPSVSHRF